MSELDRLKEKYSDLINNKGLADIIALKQWGDAGGVCSQQDQTLSYEEEKKKEEAYFKNLPAFIKKTKSALSLI